MGRVTSWRMELIAGVVKEVETENPRRYYPNREFLYVDISGIDNVHGVIKEWRKLQGKDAPSRARQKIRRDDVLVSTVRPNLNATALVPEFLDGQICSTGFCVLRSSEAVIPKYLYFFTRMADFAKSLSSLTRGASYPAVTDREVKGLRIPLPPIETQKRIVDVLDRTQRLRMKRQRANQLTSKIIQSVFLKMFGDPITNPREWIVKKIGDVSHVVRGSSPRPKGSRRYFGGSVPRLMIADITRDGSPVFPCIDSLTEEGAKRSRLVRKGTVVIAVSGNVGLTSILGVDACIHDGFVALLDLKESLNPNYLQKYLESIRLINLSRSSGAIWKNLTTHEIRDIDILVPPIEVQDRFSDIVEHHRRLGREQSNSTQEIQQLINSLMHKAFRGELRIAANGVEDTQTPMPVSVQSDIQSTLADYVGDSQYQR